jgi:myxalamid-type polyketide synthase MxaE and MxaD
MDSLMSIELKGRLEASVGQILPATLLFNYPTVSALAEYLVTQVIPTENIVSYKTGLRVEARSAPQVPTTVLSDGNELSEDQLAVLLAKKLDQLER